MPRGYLSRTIGQFSHAEGYQTTASSDYSHAEVLGQLLLVTVLIPRVNQHIGGQFSHAGGQNSSANGQPHLSMVIIHKQIIQIR
jgi:hypothetical protein